MPTLYVDGVPEELYEALRQRARSSRRSIAAETISILEMTVPTPTELRRRRASFRRILEIRKLTAKGAPGPSAQELLREDRER